jgi:hypothetical protein
VIGTSSKFSTNLEAIVDELLLISAIIICVVVVCSVIELPGNIVKSGSKGAGVLLLCHRSVVVQCRQGQGIAKGPDSVNVAW